MILFYIFSWTYSKFLFCSSFTSPYLVNILVSNGLNSLSDKFFFCFIHCFFSFFFLFPSFEVNSSAFSFCLILSVSIRLGGILLFWSWKGVLLWKCPYAVCVCPVEGKVGSEVSVGHNFSKDMLAAITLVGGEAEGRGLEPELGVNQSIFYLQESSPSYRGQDEVLRCWSRSPESWVQLVLFQVYTHLSPSQQWYHHPRAEQCWSKMGQGGCSAWTVQAASQSSRWLLIYYFCECQQWLPLPGSDAALGSSELHPLPIVHSLRQ